MTKHLRLYISPSFLSRFYTSRDVQFILNHFKFNGDILDYGCGQKPYSNMFKDCNKYIGIDFPDYSINKDMHNGKPDIFLGKDFLKNYKLPFDNNSFDSTVSFQVLEHHIDPKMMIAEMARVTKPGGYILLTAPFLGGLHEEPHDYQRLTKYGIKVLLENNKYKKVFKEQGSLFSTISLLFNEYLTSYMFHRNLKRYLCITIYPIFLLFSYLSFILDKFIKSNKIFLTILY